MIGCFSKLVGGERELYFYQYEEKKAESSEVKHGYLNLNFDLSFNQTTPKYLGIA